MKILVTTGTGKFNSLVTSVLDCSGLIKSKIDVQCGVSADMFLSEYPDIKFYNFIDDLTSKIFDYDLVISHCGAGNVFHMLENSINFIAVPNLERHDKHQLELANYLHNNNLCPVCFDVSDILKFILNYDSLLFENYKKEEFFLTEFLINFINKS